MVKSSKERVARYRAKKREGHERIVGSRRELKCVVCGAWKDEDDFRVRGTGRDRMCLDCSGGGVGICDQHPGFENPLFDELLRRKEKRQKDENKG